VNFLREAAFLKQFYGFAHSTATGLVAVHQFGFGRQSGAAFQSFGGDAGKQIAVDLVVFAHGNGCVVLKAGTLGNARGFVYCTNGGAVVDVENIAAGRVIDK
jgi:hypothetical protein